MDKLVVAKAVGRAPEALDAGARHLLTDHLDHFVEDAVGLKKVCLPGSDVRVMEAEIADLRLFHELKRRMDARFCAGDVIIGLVPGTIDRWSAEGIVAAIGEGVPPAHCEAEVFTHRFSGDDLRGIIILERERVLTFRPFVSDFADLLKICHGGRSFGRLRFDSYRETRS